MLVVQHDFLDEIRSRVVAPLVKAGALPQNPRLNPGFEIEGESVFLSPTELAVFPTEMLRARLTNVMHDRDAIMAAIYLVFTGI